MQKILKFSFRFLRNLQSKGSHRIARSRAQRELTILIGDMGCYAAHPICVEDGNAKFANRFGGETDSRFDATKIGKAG